MVAFSELPTRIFFENDACREPMLSPLPAQHHSDQHHQDQDDQDEQKKNDFCVC